MSCNVKTYGVNVKKYCERRRIRIDGNLVWVYKLKEEKKKYFEILDDSDLMNECC